MPMMLKAKSELSTTEATLNLEERADSGKGFDFSPWEGAIRWKEDGRGVAR